MFCSDTSRFFSLHIPMSTIKQMEKINVSPLMVSNIIQNGVRLKGTSEYQFLYVCNEKNIGIVVNEITGQVTNIIPKICAHDFQTKRDIAAKKIRIRTI